MGRVLLRVVGFLIVVVLLLIIFWNWDWFIPIVEAQASSALGRKVTLQHFGVRLGETTTITARGITINNPQNFPADEPPLATVDKLVVQVNVLKYIQHQVLSLTTIEVDHPVASVRQLPSGETNYALHFASSGKSSGKPPELGDLIINNGSASVIMPLIKSNFDLGIQTRNAPPGDKLFTGGEIVVDAHGTYAAAPITGRFIGGALLSLRDPSIPYPIDLHIENGTTKASLVGTVEDPENFAGAHLKLAFSGQNMANLYQLTGVPIPQTPPFSLTGNLDYSKNAFRFENFAGRVGSSDLEGTITEAPGSPRRTITADLISHRVDLADLAGFLGGTPGKTTTPGQDAATKAQLARANASSSLLPTKPFDLPKINIANIDLRYRGEHIINRDVPFDDLVVHLIINDGRITVDPLNFAVGTGTIASNFDLDPVGHELHTKANIDFEKLQLSRLMAATHAFAGNGTVGGGAYLNSTGDSVATILGNGNGHASLYLENGANISALLVDLAGLQVGDAILSALGIPTKTNIQCLVSDFQLTDGVMDTKTFLLATKEANILGSGDVNLKTQKLDLALRTEATHFQIGSLSTPIDIGGTLKSPSVLPAAGPLAAKAGGAVALGILFPPLALIPTIRLGLGDKNACEDTIRAVNSGHPHNPS
jgi:uncharacterized protein involved in outer membrane biogenesis